jgi:predicted exporter
VFLAATSTVLGFGLLAISEHPMLATIGITATAGMVASLLLAPTALVLWREDGASAARGSHDVGVSA